jgi:hypothetical protein
MAHLVRLSDVWRMLDHCLAGYVRSEKPHRWTVKHAGRIYPRIPLGPHGHRHNPEVEAGHIRGLVNFFGIPRDCYELFLNLR